MEMAPFWVVVEQEYSQCQSPPREYNALSGGHKAPSAHPQFGGVSLPSTNALHEFPRLRSILGTVDSVAYTVEGVKGLVLVWQLVWARVVMAALEKEDMWGVLGGGGGGGWVEGFSGGKGRERGVGGDGGRGWGCWREGDGKGEGGGG